MMTGGWLVVIIILSFLALSGLAMALLGRLNGVFGLNIKLLEGLRGGGSLRSLLFMFILLNLGGRSLTLWFCPFCDLFSNGGELLLSMSGPEGLPLPLLEG
jgi:hypothetical protein